MPFENPAFEPDGNTAIELDSRPPSYSPPAFRRTISHYEIDAISVVTESTVPSEIVEKRIEAHMRQQRAEAQETDDFQRKNNVHYKFNIDRLVILGGEA
jgi:hypothetical protein